MPNSDDFLVIAKTLVAKDQNSCSICMDTFKNNHNYTHIWVRIILGVRVTTYIFLKSWISKICNSFSL